MQHKIVTLFIFLLISVLSCTTNNSFPEKKTKRMPVSGYPQTDILIKNENQSIEKWNEINGLLNLYFGKSPEFSLLSFEEQWKIFRENNKPEGLAPHEIKKWIETTGLLFELTADAVFAEEMENLVQLFPAIQNLVDPFVFTKNIDNIHINLFKNRQIEFLHTLGGDVNIRLETNLPDSGKVRIYFEMAKKRYIELHIRIPSWATGTTVTVKNVKYAAPIGDYCKIAKQWRDGDVVELELPPDKIPDFYSHK